RDTLILYGGNTYAPPNISAPPADLWTFTPTTRTWAIQPLTIAPNAIAPHQADIVSCVVAGSTLFMVINGDKRPNGQLHTLDLESWTWTSVANRTAEDDAGLGGGGGRGGGGWASVVGAAVGGTVAVGTLVAFVVWQIGARKRTKNTVDGSRSDLEMNGGAGDELPSYHAAVVEAESPLPARLDSAAASAAPAVVGVVAACGSTAIDEDVRWTYALDVKSALEWHATTAADLDLDAPEPAAVPARVSVAIPSSDAAADEKSALDFHAAADDFDSPEPAATPARVPVATPSSDPTAELVSALDLAPPRTTLSPALLTLNPADILVPDPPKSTTPADEQSLPPRLESLVPIPLVPAHESLQPSS
ncbi:hypothetical protein BDK51DRAFT_42381, partial [Blyttiomyces helicus]